MTHNTDQLDQRIATLERSMRRWRAGTLVACALGGVVALAAFSAPPQQVVEAERIVLRGRAFTAGARSIPAPRIELSVGALGGLYAEFVRDSAPRGNVAISPTELRLTDENGREVGRIGGSMVRPLVR